MKLFLFVSTSILLSFQTYAASSFEMYKQCIETCTAYEDQPGYGLRACVSECQRRYLAPAKKMMNMPGSSETNWCETYEDECDRPETGI